MATNAQIAMGESLVYENRIRSMLKERLNKYNDNYLTGIMRMGYRYPNSNHIGEIASTLQNARLSGFSLTDVQKKFLQGEWD